MSKPNPYCEVLGIDVPRLEIVKDRPDANYYSLLIVALLERGEPITLEETVRYWRRGAAIRVHDDGLWELDVHHDALPSARKAVLERIEMARRLAHMRPDPAVLEASRRRIERQRRAHAEELARMRRVLLYGFPRKKPEVLVLLDVQRRELSTFVGEEIAEATRRIADYDVIAGVGVRGLLRTLDFDPGERRLGELGPPQKTRQLNKRGRTLEITVKLLVQGSCGIGRPFGDEKVLRRYLSERRHTRLRRRLEADAKSLFAMYEYGRLHGAVRLRWGFLDEMLPAPWVHRDEPTLYHLKEQALERNIPLEVVLGSAPGWSHPWSRGQLAFVEKEPNGWHSWIADEGGHVIDEGEIQ